MKLTAALAGLALAVTALALVGCSASESEVPATATKPAAVEATPATERPAQAAPVSAPAIDRQAEWSAAVASFAQPLPSGASWPTSVPDDWPAGGTRLNGGDVATYFWACSVLSTAKAEADAGNADAAARVAESVNAVTPPHGAQMKRDTWDVVPGNFSAGDSGLCTQWFDGWVNR